MVNTKRKGNKLELEYRQMKEAQGYSCYKSPNVRFYAVDIFGLFDLICINKKEVLLVQVKANRIRDRKKIQAFTNHPKEVKKIIAVKKDRQGWTEHII